MILTADHNKVEHFALAYFMQPRSSYQVNGANVCISTRHTDVHTHTRTNTHARTHARTHKTQVRVYKIEHHSRTHKALPRIIAKICERIYVSYVGVSFEDLCAVRSARNISSA